MAVFNEPQKWAQTLGQDADVTTIPNTAGDTDPCIDKIFPSVFSIPLKQGGRAIPRSVLNGLFKLVGDWSFYAQNGGLASYSNTFDYTVGRVVTYNNNIYKCIADNGASSTVASPDNPSYWQRLDGKADTDFSNITNTAKIAIAHNSMPSNVFDDLTLGSSGTQYTAPADGYVAFDIATSGTNQYVQITNITSNYAIKAFAPLANINMPILLPVRKGDVFSIVRTATGGLVYLKFIYAVGSESEQ